MPTYEFTCPNGHDFEKFFRTISGGASELPCPECGAVAARKISGGAGLMFKGTGFYITDYGKDGKKDQNLSRKSANGDGGSSSSDGGSSDSKSAEPKSSDSKTTDSKSSGSKPMESKSGDSKSGESKPAPKAAEQKSSAPKSSSSSE